MHNLLLIDETPNVDLLFKEILELEGEEFGIKTAADKTDAEMLIRDEKPEMLFVNADSEKCLGILKELNKKNICPPFVIMGKDPEEKQKALGKLKAIDSVELPFDPKDFFFRTEDDLFLAAGKFDELTGLFKKPWFDCKLERLMKKKTEGTLFCMSIDAYSFAANRPNPLQIQMAAYALKTNFKEDGILGIHGTTVLGFFPTARPRRDNQKYIDGLIKTMCGAADEPPVFICAGAAESKTYDFSAEDTYVYANKAMGMSIEAGKNCVRYYK
ncbi:MAG: hypothetical protein NC394_09050 [Bacteroides sp.]|nr:hypothetical protein [Bacteroides sp.]